MAEITFNSWIFIRYKVRTEAQEWTQLNLKSQPRHLAGTHYCRPWIHSGIMITYYSIAVNTYTLDTHSNVDPMYILLSLGAL